CNQKSADRLHRWSSRLGFLTLLAVSIYAGITYLQWRVMSKQLAIASSNAESSQRAYFAAGEPVELLGGYGLFRIPIENYGHVPSHGFSLRMNYQRSKTPDVIPVKLAILDNRIVSMKTDETVQPGPAGFAITIMIPQLSASDQAEIRGGKQYMRVRAQMEYDTGFNKTDTLDICAFYSSRNGRWINCGGGRTDIDLGEAKQR
ncbi:MAG: hypothetical protein NT090_01245, partial [Acidobacteria bacterium]|nr:hypothetical protein [Acidobacteriota bacterium]